MSRDGQDCLGLVRVITKEVDMTYVGNPPPAPDIRQQRPEYFYRDQGVDFPDEFVMPQGMQRFDPMADPWHQHVPDLWPELEQKLMAILEQQPELFMPKEGRPLTPEQEAHNKMLLAWKSPAGLSAIETGKYREFAQKQADIERAEKRVENLGKQLATVAKMEDAPPGLVKTLESQYNRAIDQLDALLPKDSKSELPKYTGEGRFQLEIERAEKGPGIIDRLKGWLQGEPSRTAPPAREEPLTESPGAGPGSVPGAIADMLVPALVEGEKIIRKHFGTEKAQKEITNLTARTQTPEGQADPDARARETAKTLRKIGTEDAMRAARQMEAFAMTRGRKAWQSGMTEEPSAYRRFMARRRRAMPTNKEYIEGGGLPGLVIRKIRGE